MKWPVVVWLLWIGACGRAEDLVQTISKRRVLLLSFDGFRWDYVGRFSTPNLDALAAQGVHAPVGVRTAFVTKTFPDHYTIATGLYEESHGIVSNRMYDSQFNATFRPGNNETRWWDGGQPIWTTATLQGLKTGVYFWPGSEVELNGVRPYRWEHYKKSVPFEDRVDIVIDWMMDDQLDLTVAYFHEPDQTGHTFGAMSPDLGVMVQRMDNLVGYLLKKLQHEGVLETTDILIVSDHGMTNITADDQHVIVLSDYLDLPANVQIMPDHGALVNILPWPGKKELVYQSLKAHPNMSVYKKEDIPEALHYKHHRRILPILALADEGYYIAEKRPYNTKHHLIGPGEHGYDNGLSSMRPIFFARGPHFRKGFNLTDTNYETVHIYPLLCHLLNIRPSPNNGSLEASMDMLVQVVSGSATLRGQSFLLGCLVLFLLKFV